MTSSSSGGGPKFLAFGLAPFVVGVLLKLFVIPEDVYQVHVEPLIPDWTVRFLSTSTGVDDAPTNDVSMNAKTESPTVTPKCHNRFEKILGNSMDDQRWENMSLFLHRHGEPTPCSGGDAKSGRSFIGILEETYAKTYPNCPSNLDKYQTESLLTTALHRFVDSCLSVESDGKKSDGFVGYCDMGEAKTPILLDHDKLIPVVSGNGGGKKFLPCHFHTREGLRISKLDQLASIMPPPCQMKGVDADGNDNNDIDKQMQTCSIELAKEVHLYAVPAGRVFMFAPAYVGEIFDLPHVDGSDDKMISLEVMSLNPRVFDVYNFFSREESQGIVDGAMAEGRESHRIKRSTTGSSSKSINSRRTSESGFDTHGETSVKVKKRCFAALGFDEYIESHGDGLQILRYNLTTAYNTHLDYFEDKSRKSEHDFDSAHKGGNRFATILMYMSDLGPEDGGETVFPDGWPPHLAEEDRVSKEVALEELRASEQGNVLQHGSWEEDLVAKCRSRLAVRPHSSRAVLFYSQFPNGEMDPASIHGACPVLDKQKYAANLWVWNTPRQGYPGAPMNEKLLKEKEKEKNKQQSSPANTFTQIDATFQNSGGDPNMENAELYFEDQFWGKLGKNDPSLHAKTYRGHVWNVKVAGQVVKTWTVAEKNGETQNFSV